MIDQESSLVCLTSNPRLNEAFDMVVLLMSETIWTSVDTKSQIIGQRTWPFCVSSEIEMCLGCCSLSEAEVMLAFVEYQWWKELVVIADSVKS